MEVELKCAGIPYLSAIAVHYWFVTVDGGRRDRWEVWQRANAGGTSIGHLHFNLMHADASVGGSAARTVNRWQGDESARIAEALYRSCEAYPYRHRYRAIPGPNSNTFVAWILREAMIAHNLSWRGIGKGYA
jgi:hypothetical protein